MAGKNENAVMPTSKDSPIGTCRASMPMKCIDQIPVAKDNAAPPAQSSRSRPMALAARRVMATAVIPEVVTASTERNTSPNWWLNTII